MSTIFPIELLPFWILGVPLTVALINYVQLPRRRNFVPPDRRYPHKSSSARVSPNEPAI